MGDRDNEPDPLSGEQIAALDGLYKPFPSFADFEDGLEGAQVDRAYEDALSSLLDIKSSFPADSAHLARVREEMMRAAAWDTGALEDLYVTDYGVTVSVAQQLANWEVMAAEAGEDARELFDAQLEAYQLVLDMVTESRPVTEMLIRQLHEVVTAPQATYDVRTPVGVQHRELKHGQYKHHPNHVRQSDGTIHAYAPVLQTPAEMERFIDEIHSDEFVAGDPIIQSAYVHYAFVYIHPFADGNGRVARALASIYTYRNCHVPFYVFADEKERYRSFLAEADRGYPAAFYRFVLRWTTQAMNAMDNRLSMALRDPPAAVSQRIRDLLHARGGLGHAELEKVATALVSQLHNLLTEAADQYSSSEFRIGITGGNIKPSQIPDGYRVSSQLGGKANLIGVQVSTSSPVKVSESEGRVVVMSKAQGDAGYDFVVIEPSSGVVDLGLWVHEIHPEATTAFLQRAEAWARRFVSDVVETFSDSLREAMETQGYI